MLDVDVSLQRGRFSLTLAHQFADDKVTAIFGASGCGKSSLLRCIAGLELAAKGRITWNSETWLDNKKSVKPENRGTAMVFQQANLFSKQRVAANILYGLPKQQSAAFISPADVIELLQLDNLLQRYPDELSGGQQQRVALARALLSQPKLLLLDEPMTGLDSAAKHEILSDLKRIQRQFKLPMLLVSHHIDEIVPLADEVVLIKDGAKVSSGTLVEQGQHLASASDGPLSILEIERITTDSLHGLHGYYVGQQKLWLPMDLRDQTKHYAGKMRLLVWARDVSIALQPLAETSVSNQVQATIVAIDNAKHVAEKVVTLMVEEQRLRAVITQLSCQRLGLNVGQQVTAAFKAAALH